MQAAERLEELQRASCPSGRHLSGPPVGYMLDDNSTLLLTPLHQTSANGEVVNRIGVAAHYLAPMTAQDLSAGRDPGLAKALALPGIISAPNRLLWSPEAIMRVRRARPRCWSYTGRRDRPPSLPTVHTGGSPVLRRMNPSAVAAPTGKYHHVVTVPAGSDLAFVSGQVGYPPDGGPPATDPAAQAQQAFDNVGAIVREIGATPSDIVKFTTLVVGPEGLAGFRAARDAVFADWYPDGDVPANTLMMVAGLASVEILVEIEAVVALPR